MNANNSFMIMIMIMMMKGHTTVRHRGKNNLTIERNNCNRIIIKGMMKWIWKMKEEVVMIGIIIKRVNNTVIQRDMKWGGACQINYIYQETRHSWWCGLGKGQPGWVIVMVILDDGMVRVHRAVYVCVWVCVSLYSMKDVYPFAHAIGNRHQHYHHPPTTLSQHQ